MINKVFTILALTLLLAGCEPARLPPKEAHLNERAVQQFLQSRSQAVSSADANAIRGHYSFRVTFSLTNLKGQLKADGYREVLRLSNLMEKYGKDYKEKVLERYIVVDSGQKKAIVEERTQEVWLFNEKYDDFALEVVTKLEIELIDQVPQIVDSHRRVIAHTPLEDAKGMSWSDVFQNKG